MKVVGFLLQCVAVVTLGVGLGFGLFTYSELPTDGESVWLSAVEMEFGSGTLIDVRGAPMILTAAHVIEDDVEKLWATRADLDNVRSDVWFGESKDLPVAFKNLDGRQKKFRARVVCWTPSDFAKGHDLALLSVDALPTNIRPATVAPRWFSPRVGDPAWYAGNPSLIGTVLERSIICDFNFPGSPWSKDVKQGRRNVLVAGLEYYGSSGSGIFAKRYFWEPPQLVGVLCCASMPMVSTQEWRGPSYGATHRSIQDLIDIYLCHKGKP